MRLQLLRGSISARTVLGLLALATLPASIGRAAGAEAIAKTRRPMSYETDVMAVISRAGCNAGVCHGNRSGKGGFRLSLRGQDPAQDFAALSREVGGRRVDPFAPERSLILLKATAEVPHEGGERFPRSSPEYATLRDWIAAGLPRDPEGAPRPARLDVAPTDEVAMDPCDSVQLTARAVFTDGEELDVTRLAVYEASQPSVSVSPDGRVSRHAFGESTVLVRYLGLQAPARVAFIPSRGELSAAAATGDEATDAIDGLVLAKLRRLRLEPAPLAGDGIFLRRVYLDLLGILPDAGEARAFVADPNPAKRERLVDRLLEREEFNDFWALKWADLLRLEEKVLDRKGVQAFHGWIRSSIARKKPLDLFCREILAARGSTYQSPPANFYRAARDPLTRAETAAQVFLGVRLGCARCHNHPFDRWTQDDYYGWAALFARVSYKVLENRRRDQNDSHEFDGEQVVWMASAGEVNDPRTEKPAPPRFLGAPATTVAAGEDRLEALARWLTSAENPQFARNIANRVWFHVMGRGLVEPVDDFRASNPPSHPEILELLAQDLVASDFDLRRLVRRLVLTRTYALAAAPASDAGDDGDGNYSGAIVRRLSAEQILDCQSQVCGVAPRFNGYPEGLRAAQLPGVTTARARDQRASAADQFLRLFGKPQRLLACECERSDDSTLGQAFQLLSDGVLNGMIRRPDNRLGEAIATGALPRDVVEGLYWAALTRPPSDAELGAALAHIEPATDRRAALEDLLWSLLNAKELLLRH